MLILVDSNVLLDLITNDTNWYHWSFTTLETYRQQNELAINPIVFTEISVAFERIEELRILLKPFVKLPLDDETCFLAGKVYKAYKKNQGTQKSFLPDFFIGAHASILGIPLITRDLRRYQTYFPKLHLISPSYITSEMPVV